MNNEQLTALRYLMNFGNPGPEAFHGVRIMTVRDLARSVGWHWRRSPAGATAAPRMVMALLPEHIHLFGPRANLAVGAAAIEMAPAAMSRLGAGDWVALVDERYGLWWPLVEAQEHLLDYEPPAHFGLVGDEVQRANLIDLIWLREQVIMPAFCQLWGTEEEAA